MRPAHMTPSAPSRAPAPDVPSNARAVRRRGSPHRTPKGPRHRGRPRRRSDWRGATISIPPRSCVYVRRSSFGNAFIPGPSRGERAACLHGSRRGAARSRIASRIPLWATEQAIVAVQPREIAEKATVRTRDRATFSSCGVPAELARCKAAFCALAKPTWRWAPIALCEWPWAGRRDAPTPQTLRSSPSLTSAHVLHHAPIHLTALQIERALPARGGESIAPARRPDLSTGTPHPEEAVGHSSGGERVSGSSTAHAAHARPMAAGRSVRVGRGGGCRR